MIPNASVKLTQTAAGVTREGVTNERGDFIFSAVVTVPTALERAGDFSQTTDVNGAKVYIRDPLKTGTCNATSQISCFDNQIIPANRLDANGLALLKLMPLPNFTDLAITGRRYNYVSEKTNNLLQRVETIKLDFHPSHMGIACGLWCVNVVSLERSCCLSRAGVKANAQTIRNQMK